MLKRLASEKKMLSILYVALFVFFSCGFPQSYTQIAQKKYVGAGRCNACRQKEYAQWMTSGHSQILHRSSDFEIRNLPVATGYARKDISYVIGVYKWKALFLNKKATLLVPRPPLPGAHNTT